MENVILFRALNKYDEENLKNNGDIKCLLLNSKESNKKIKNINVYYNLCLHNEGKYALDTIVGHIQGGKLKNETSCWISTTSSFDLACSEYSIPQSGNYNHFEKRKNIISIDVEKGKILCDVDKIRYLRDKINLEDIFIDLRNSNLNKYYNKCFLSETYNEDMPGYNFIKNINREILNIITNVNGFSNFATASEEVLVYKNIKKEIIKNIYYPIQQDISYGCKTTANLDINLLEYACNKLNLKQKELYDLLYPSITQGNNLTDILIQNYSNIDGNNIYEKYNNLKKEKSKLLFSIIETLNSKSSNNNLIMQRLVDDGILVYSTNEVNKKSRLATSEKNDIIVVEHDGNLYKYSHEDKGYVCEKGKLLKKSIFKSK